MIQVVRIPWGAITFCRHFQFNLFDYIRSLPYPFVLVNLFDNRFSLTLLSYNIGYLMLLIRSILDINLILTNTGLQLYLRFQQVENER